MSIQNYFFNPISWCEKETVNLKASLPSEHVFLELTRRILVVVSLIIPLIGLIAKYLALSPQPDVSQNRSLSYLNFSSNQLTQAPDVSGNPNLQKLNLSGNRLTQAPDVSQNPNLESLNLTSNQLTQAPDVSGNPNLEYLVLQQNQLTQAPDVSRAPNLTCLDLAHNRLTQAPDVSGNPNLQKLNLSGNRLTQAPDVNQNPNLESLNLISNQLIQASNISGNPNLQTLNLSSNRLIQAPDVRRNPNLQTLYLSYNQLTQAPDVSGNPNLTCLALADNRLTRAPDVSHNVDLLRLDLSRNQLTQTSDVSRNAKLMFLSLIFNRLTQAPDVSRNLNIRYLDLSYNLLQTLPDAYLLLPSTLTIDANNNRFSAEFVTEFQQRLATQRLLDPSTGPTVRMSVFDAAARAGVQGPLAINTLSAELTSWSQGLNVPIDFSPLNQMDEENRTLLCNYLLKLKETADYRDVRTRPNIISRAQSMLKIACEKEPFKEILFALIREGSESCGDRVILLFNDIEVQSQVYAREYSAPEFAQLVMKIQRFELLKAYAKKVARELRLYDEVETILYYEIKLKEALSLPITTVAMLYPAMAGVSDQMLSAAQEEIGAISNLDLLAQSELWRAHLRKDLPGAFTAITEQSVAQVEVAMESSLPEQEIRNQIQQIEETREGSLRERARQLTLPMGVC